MRRYQPSDLGMVNGWYVARGKPALPAEVVPTFGAIEPGVAAGFLYRTDSSVAMLEGFVSNPEASAPTRARALSAIVEILTELARAEGFHRVVGWCGGRGMVSLGERLGFRSIGSYALMAREV